MENTTKYIIVMVAIVALVAVVSMITSNSPKTNSNNNYDNVLTGNVIADDYSNSANTNPNAVWNILLGVGLIGACIFLYRNVD